MVVVTFYGAPATYSWEAATFHAAAAVVAMKTSHSYFVQLLLLLFVSYKMYHTLQLSNAMQRHATRKVIHSGSQPSVLLYDDKIQYMGFTVVQDIDRRSSLLW